MATLESVTERPGSPEQAAELLRGLGEERRAVRPRGGSTKLAWGGGGEPVAVELETGGMAKILEHNEGDLTAVLQAGVPLAEAQAAFREKKQMLALDPPLGPASPDGSSPASPRDAATIGGVVATADSGPLRHRYGGVRDLVVGMSIALSDGALAKSGGKVIKNVAGYDLGKLYAGSFGTLGLIVSVNVRLHPAPTGNATAVGASDDPDRLAAAATRLAGLPLEADSLDVGWHDGAGRLLARFGGAAGEHQAKATSEHLREAGLSDVETIEDDEELWASQRAGQRSADGAVLKVSGRMGDLAPAIRAAQDAGGGLVGRAAHGLLWITLKGDGLPERVGMVRDALDPRACTLLDGPDSLRSAIEPWGPVDPGALVVMRRVKERFDPARIFRPGAFVGGI
ncbi:MAG: FAD-binding oxidoreductase [Solirubrobacteraceae bacterium]